MIDFTDMAETKKQKTVKAPAGKNPLDIQRAKNALKPYIDTCKNEKSWAESFEIKCDDDLIVASERMLKNQKLFKTLDAKRLETTQDARNFTSRVNSIFKAATDFLSDSKSKTGAVEIIKLKIGVYSEAQRIKRLEAEKRARDEQAKLQAQIDADAKKSGIEPVQMPRMVVPQRSGPLRTESGSASVKMEWTWEQVDLGKVPRSYLMIDIKAVDAAIKSGIRDIPGIRIFEQPKVMVRTA
jgi:hypothetical protein